jgi:hypothetical protein
MTKLLEHAIDRIRQLPEPAQDELAHVILEEMEAEQLWEKSLSRDPAKLLKLADEALREYNAGQTEPLDPEQL